MRRIVLIAAAPLVLTACGLDAAGNNNSAASAAPGAVPDEITVNGVTYVRADKSTPAPTATRSSNSLFGSSTPPNTGSSTTSDSGSTVPPNTGTGGAAADHGE